MIKVLVVIVTYNAMKWIDKSFSSVFTQKNKELNIQTDLFVVDNGSKDGTQEYIKTQYPQTILYESPLNLGFGKANNLGLQYALDNNYHYAYLLNQDAWLKESTISELIKVHQKYPFYGILSPFQMEANEKRLDKGFLCNVCTYDANPNILNDFYFNNKSDVYSVPDVMAAHWLISRECIQKVGGFSPTFPHCGEDNNLENRCLFHGYQIGIVPHVKAIHDREHRIENRENDYYMMYIMQLRILSDINNSHSQSLLKSICTLLYKSIKNKSKSLIKYAFRILSEYPSIKHNKKESYKIGAFLK